MFTSRDMLKALKEQNENYKEQQLERMENRLEDLIGEAKASLQDFKNTKNRNLVRLGSIQGVLESLKKATQELETLEQVRMNLDRMEYTFKEDDEDE